jgi:hypothetical protein
VGPAATATSVGMHTKARRHKTVCTALFLRSPRPQQGRSYDIQPDRLDVVVVCYLGVGHVVPMAKLAGREPLTFTEGGGRLWHEASPYRKSARQAARIAVVSGGQDR